AALSLGAGALFGMSFGQEIANHSLQLYKLDTMAAQVKFMEWWQRKSA
ncbi:succinate dehydrogenase subunit 6, mitochondrial, partial [Tanacetum coccineum]